MSDSDLRSLTGRIFDIQRFSIHDGPGIRTTVFVKGCPLHCAWCHNPEGISRERHLSYVARNCIGCGYCYRVCPHEVHVTVGEKGHELRRERCAVCGRCTEECYARALELVGRDATVGEVIDEVVRDRAFYETSSGGLTLSGGEPLQQIEFTEALLRVAQAERLHRAVETCGFAAWERLERILPLVDLFLYDLKETDPARHEAFTGVANALILENLRALHDRGAAVLLRLPIVPGMNDRPDHFAAVAKLVAGMPRLLGVEIMPYHRLGTGKRERLGLAPDSAPVVEMPSPEAVAGWVTDLRRRGVTVVNEV